MRERASSFFDSQLLVSIIPDSVGGDRKTTQRAVFGATSDWPLVLPFVMEVCVCDCSCGQRESLCA